MAQRDFELSDVERCVAERRKGLRFSAPIEAAFQAHAGRYQARAAGKTILPTVIAYNVFLIVDYLLFPATFWLAATLHIAVVTPLIIGSSLAIMKEPPFAVRETLAALIPFVMAVQIMTMYAVNDGPAADQYQYLTIMILVHMNISHRLDHHFAFAATLAILAVYLGILLSGDTTLAVKLIGAMCAVAAAFVTLAANRRMERETRHAFLTRLIDQMRREEAQAAADRDALTGLWNRRHLDQWLKQIWNDPRAAASTMTVIMLDIDNFKTFNDYYGHPAGDLCLKRVAATIVAQLRDEADRAVRVGGEEFMVLLPDTELQEGIQIAERIRRSLEATAIPHLSQGATAVVTASLGIMAGPVAKHSPGELIAGADAALYAAKRSGRNRVWPPLVAVDQAVARLPANQAASSPGRRAARG
jgi:diguanylate cyclase (GGDEF)-like protein